MRTAKGTLIILLVLALVPTVGGVESPFRDGRAGGRDSTAGGVNWPGLMRDFVGGQPARQQPSGPVVVPANAEAPVGRAWPDQKRVEELVGQRTANAKFFQLSDGRVQAEISADPMHYLDPAGRWQPIDTRVEATGRQDFPLGNASNAFTSLFGGRPDRLIRFEQDGRYVELGLAGATTAAVARQSGSTVTYPRLAGGADLVYQVTPSSLEEKIVLSERPTGPVSFTFTVATGGLVADPRADGSIGFVRPSGGEPVFEMPAPYVYDAADEAQGRVWTEPVSQRLTRMYGQTTLTLSVDGNWLRDSARQYPVVVDPTIRIQPVPTDAQDVQIYSGATGTNYNNTYQLKVGTDASSAYRTLVRFPLTGVPAGAALDDARLEMYYDQTHHTWGFDVAMEARRVTQPWNESTATWANMNANMAAQPAGNMVQVDDGDAGTSVSGSWPFSTNTQLTALAVNGDYRFNNDAIAGHTHTWTPTITETGDYQVEVHYVTESDRATNAAYTVHHAAGSTAYPVNQTGGARGQWTTLGVHRFNAGTTGRVVLADVANKAVIADAVRFTRWGVTTKKAAISSVWSSFPVRNVVQEWVNGTQPNHGFMVKAVDEGKLGRGGPVFEASEFAYANGARDFNLPRLVLTWGRPSVTLAAPTYVTATGAKLDWSAYADPSPAPADNIVEYQVHRSVFQTFTPSAATLVAPLSPTVRTYQDTSGRPTPADTPDTELGQLYYYMVAVKTADGQVIPGVTQSARLPKAGQIKQIVRSSTVDTTLSAARPTENVDVYDGDPYVSPGNNSGFYGDTRGLVKFSALTGIPANARITSAQLRMWNTSLFPGTDTDEFVDVHQLTRAFNETTATWNQAAAGVPWTTPGGDFRSAALSGDNGFTNDPEWASWQVRSAVEEWLANPASNHGLLVKQRDEVSATARAMLLSSEAQESMLRPTLEVTYLQPTAESTYHASATPELMNSGGTYSLPVTVSNPTLSSWAPVDWAMSYRWTLPDGTPAPNAGPPVRSELPKTVVPGDTVELAAQVVAPSTPGQGQKRTEYTLTWELVNKATGQPLSATTGIAGLPQRVAAEEPTSDQLGLEQFYAYTGTNTGAGASLMNNLYAGNTVWSYDAFTNPSRGLSTFVRLAHNSLDTSDTVTGHGWSLQASSPIRLGTALDFHPNPHPTRITLTDGDGTSHWFTLNEETGQWVSPRGVYLHLQRNVECGNRTEEARAWTMTRPDRTEFHFDCDGYISAVADNNGNELLFTYEVRRSQNKPTKFLRYLTDPTGRRTLTIDYYAKGESYSFIDDTTWSKVSATNLTNPKIIDHVKQITDVSGRKLTFTYTDKGLLGELIDGAGSTNGAPKVFAFRYDMTQGNKNVKLVRVTDPRGNATNLTYYSPPEDDPKFHWRTKTYSDRLGGITQFAYTDPDGPQGDTIHTTVTDPENRSTAYQMDAFGRPTQTTNAKNQTTKLTWDGQHNVVRLEEANGATQTWVYDQKTGYPLEIKDAQAVADGTAGTVLTYGTGLDGFTADLATKTSPEGRRWAFGYTTEGDLAFVIDPQGNTTPDPNDFRTTYTYDTWGQQLTATDANGNVTTNSDFEASGYPRLITDALNTATRFEYDVRGNVLTVTDALNKVTTQTYDTYGRTLESRVPFDQNAGQFIVTPAPVYDPNDNVTRSFAPNGAVGNAVYDAMDRLSQSLAPVDQPGDPERRTSYTYDKVGNLLTTTEPKGNLTPATGDFVTTNAYDEIYQLTSVTNALGQRLTYEYDSVGNVTRVADARKNATADPADYTTAYEYDRAHRLKKIIDPLGHVVSRVYDKDGLNVATTDQNGNTMLVTLDARGRPVESKIPHRTDNGTVVYRVTRYEYDQVGNQTRVISPRGVETTDDPDDFAAVTVYDELNRVKETRTPFDEDDARYSQPDITRYTYDDVGRLARQSAPPSSGQSVRNDTAYTYFDNGWTRRSTDAWDISTDYTYNELGGQTSRTVRSAGGSATRTITWTYHPDGKLKTRADDGVPVGQQVVLVDNSDFNNTTATGSWPTATIAADKHGPDYAIHAPGTGANTFTWGLNVPQDGTYEVFVRYPTVSGAATDARYTVTHNGASTVRTVNQSANAGTWVSLGSFAFDEGNGHRIELSDQANGTVLADAVKLVRDNAADVDNEKHDYAYRYDPNNNLAAITDASPGARVDRYAMTYTGLNQVASVVESKTGTTINTTSFEYDENGSPLSVVHDKQHDLYAYDVRNLISRVTNRTAATDPDPKITTYTYTPRGERLHEVKGNGNTVDYTYFLDGLLRSQLERKPNQTLVSEHTIDYNLNGHRTHDVGRKMNADDNSNTLSTTTDYTYDPQDRVASLTKTGTGAGTETYVHDANGNVISQSVGGVSTTFNYDRNRLLTSTAGGLTSSYNYDPFGRLDTITVAGTVVERNVYDGFDHVIENRKNNGASTSTTKYTFDPLDRTSTKTTDAGTADAKTTVYNYLGLSSEVLDEEVADKITKSYQLSPWGQRLSQVTHNDDGTEEDAFYGYNPHSDVEQLTDEEGDSKATYGYTAYGQDDVAQFTGIDKPDAADPTKEPYNAYRFNAKRFDPASGSYDMGFRDYSPGLNRFLTRDSYNGALADLNLGLNPYTGNRYAFGGGNPISGVEIDGHFAFALPALAALASAALPIVAAVVVAVVVIVVVAYVATQVMEHIDEQRRAQDDAAEEAEPQPEPRRPPPIPVGNPRRTTRGCGWVEFGDLDTAHGNRATGVTACLNSAYLATHQGSSTDAAISPPGYLWAQRTAGFLGQNPAASINKCHLLGAQLSGSGTDLRNLATCSRAANFPVAGSSQGPNNMYTYETQVRQAIEQGQDVYYQVIPQYSGDRTVPTGFTITAIGYRADGSIGLQINAYVPNDLAGRNLGTFNDPNTGQAVPHGAMP